MRLCIGVVFGGKSVEHEVSIISAVQMMENMNKLLYEVVPVYLSKDNEFYYSSKMTDIEYFKDLNNVKKDAAKVIFQNENNTHLLMENKNGRLKKLFAIDVIFLVVHGTGCEDGTLAAYFELQNIPYVGSNVLSSALNQNKWKEKQLFDYNKIPVIEYFGFYESDFYADEAIVLKSCENLGYPLIVKPASLGSSVGISKCRDTAGLKKSIQDALQYDSEIIVEKAIENLLELNCSVLGELYNYEASEVERVIQKDEILSYQDKYLRGDKESSKGMACTNRILPADIDDSLKNQIMEIAVKAVKIVGGSGVSRIDFIYDKDALKLYLNEINTIPGSLAFYLWNAKGTEYSILIDKLIGIALKNYRLKNTKTYTYESNILSMPKHFNKGKLV